MVREKQKRSGEVQATSPHLLCLRVCPPATGFASRLGFRAEKEELDAVVLLEGNPDGLEGEGVHLRRETGGSASGPRRNNQLRRLNTETGQLATPAKADMAPAKADVSVLSEAAGWACRVPARASNGSSSHISATHSCAISRPHPSCVGGGWTHLTANHLPASRFRGSTRRTPRGGIRGVWVTKWR